MHCRPDQIVNPATGRCVSRYGKIGQSILRGRKKRSKVNVHTKKEFSLWGNYRKYTPTRRLTQSQINLGKQFGVSIIHHQINRDDYSSKDTTEQMLDAHVYAKSKSDLKKWAKMIGVTKIEIS